MKSELETLLLRVPTHTMESFGFTARDIVHILESPHENLALTTRYLQMILSLLMTDPDLANEIIKLTLEGLEKCLE
ncbi:hypothetical protein HN803_03125 [candidate division WWE3 bacterium]|jgi:hypothetical protein|nr:hypothetical protein [candidate division WWE3 bacterium]